MAETVGSLVDKISIIQLRVYHLEEQLTRKDVSEDHLTACRRRLDVLAVQFKDLLEELDLLLKAVFSGRQQLKVYRQFKLYNDPKYRIQAKPSS